MRGIGDSIESKAMWRAMMAIVLGMSALLSLMLPATLDRTGGHDQQEHVSLLLSVAENPTQFPPRYEEIRIPNGEPSHLIHPPLYYYVMSIPYRLGGLDQAIPEAVSEHGVSHSALSQVLIPVLRNASLLLVFLGLLGVYKLLSFLIDEEMIFPWMSPLLAAAATMVSGIHLMTGMLNNDVMSLALWPFMTLAAIRYLIRDCKTDFYLTILMASLGVLNKGTLWMLSGAFVFWVVAVWFARQLRAGRLHFGRTLRQLLPSTGREALAFVGASAGAAAALYYLGAMSLRYGSPQPKYVAVYGLNIEDSKYFVPVENREPIDGVWDFVQWVLGLLMRSFVGFAGRVERVYPDNRALMATYLIGVIAVSLLLVVGLHQRRRSHSFQTGLVLQSFGVAFIVLFLVRSYVAYETQGRFGANGRYLIGYYQVWLVGASVGMACAWQSLEEHHARLRLSVAPVVAITVALVLGATVRPLFYFDVTEEHHARAQIPAAIHDTARDEGFELLELAATSPQSFRESGFRVVEGSLIDRDGLLMAWNSSTVMADLQGIPSGDCYEVWIYANGDRAYGKNARLRISLVELATQGGSTSTAEASIAIPHYTTVSRVYLTADRSGSPMRLEIRLENHRARLPMGMDRLWPRTRVVSLNDVFARSVEASACDEVATAIGP